MMLPDENNNNFVIKYCEISEKTNTLNALIIIMNLILMMSTVDVSQKKYLVFVFKTRLIELHSISINFPFSHILLGLQI